MSKNTKRIIKKNKITRGKKHIKKLKITNKDKGKRILNKRKNRTFKLKKKGGDITDIFDSDPCNGIEGGWDLNNRINRTRADSDKRIKWNTEQKNSRGKLSSGAKYNEIGDSKAVIYSKWRGPPPSGCHNKERIKSQREKKPIVIDLDDCRTQYKPPHSSILLPEKFREKQECVYKTNVRFYQGPGKKDKHKTGTLGRISKSEINDDGSVKVTFEKETLEDDQSNDDENIIQCGSVSLEDIPSDDESIKNFIDKEGGKEKQRLGYQEGYEKAIEFFEERLMNGNRIRNINVPPPSIEFKGSITPYCDFLDLLTYCNKQKAFKLQEDHYDYLIRGAQKWESRRKRGEEDKDKKKINAASVANFAEEENIAEHIFFLRAGKIFGFPYPLTLKSYRDKYPHFYKTVEYLKEIRSLQQLVDDKKSLDGINNPGDFKKEISFPLKYGGELKIEKKNMLGKMKLVKSYFIFEKMTEESPPKLIYYSSKEKYLKDKTGKKMSGEISDLREYKITSNYSDKTIVLENGDEDGKNKKTYNIKDEGEEETVAEYKAWVTLLKRYCKK